MSETAPWRVLEDANPPDADVLDRSVSASDGQPRFPIQPLVLIGGIGLAAVVACLAMALALIPTGGALRVETGTAASPGASGVAFSTTDAPGSTGRIVVDVGGAVRFPGVYELPVAARVSDAIAAAGGYGPRLDAARASAELNLAARLSDGDRIRVPSRDDQRTATPDAGSASAALPAAGSSSGPRLVDLNTASSSELEALPGIGPVTAGKIIAARTERPFTSIGELTTRKVLTKSTFEKVRALVTVR